MPTLKLFAVILLAFS